MCARSQHEIGLDCSGSSGAYVETKKVGVQVHICFFDYSFSFRLRQFLMGLKGNTNPIGGVPQTSWKMKFVQMIVII